MGLLDSTKIDSLFKSLLSKARTSANKQYYEENIPTAYDVHADDIYLNPIPATPPAANTSVVKVYNSTNRIILTKDVTVDNNKAWVALSTWSNNWSSGTGDITQIMKNFISPKYGKGYVVKVFKGDGTRIFELDATDWLFDYKAGVLTFENDPGQIGTMPGNSIQIEVYQYVGQFGSQVLTSASSISSLSDVDNSIAPVQNSVLTYDANTSTWQYKTITNQPALYQIIPVTTYGRVYTLPISYTMGNNSLMVFVNGILQMPGDTNQYVETDETSITFNGDLIPGDFITIRIDALSIK